MSQVIQTNAPIDFSDIKDSSDNVLDEIPSKEQIRESKRAEKEKAKEEKALAREFAKEAKKAEKSRSKEAEELGLGGSIDAQQKRAIIVRYRGSKKFGKFLKESGFKLEDKTLNKLNEEELTGLLERVQFAVANKNSEGMFKSGLMVGLQGVETIGCNNPVYPLQIQGLTATLNAREDFHEVIEEIMLENQMMVYTKPTWRLMYMVASTAMTLHSANAAFQSLPPEQRTAIMNSAKPTNEPITEPKNFSDKMAELNKEFSDILKK